MRQSSRIATRSTRTTPVRSKGSAPSTRGKGKAPLDQDSERANKPPTRKRQKTKPDATKATKISAGTVSRSTKRGKLAALQEMPLDILFEVRVRFPCTTYHRLTALHLDLQPCRCCHPLSHLKDVQIPSQHPSEPLVKVDLEEQL